MRTIRNSSLSLLALLALGVFVHLLRAQSGAPVQYFYDDLGRLTRVVDPSGNVATYNYDAVGNLLSITRSTLPANNGLAILNFTPQSGPVGATVTIQGQGFSTTPSANTVQFNGTPATVSAATASTLTVTVPSGATTGPISASVAGTTATSSASFTVKAPTLVTISVAGPVATLVAGRTIQYTATGNYSNGSTQDLTTTATWQSSNTAVATVSNQGGSQGQVTALNDGTSLIVATFGSVLGAATVNVKGVSSLVVVPATARTVLSVKQQFTAQFLYDDGSSENATQTVTWASSSTSVATISNASGSQGLATPVATGSTIISATLGSLTTYVNLSVTALNSISVNPVNPSLGKGGTQQFTATGTSSDGSSADLTAAVSWSSSSPVVALISNVVGSYGLARTLGPGTTTISATAGSISGSTTLTVTAPVPASVSVTPSTASLQAGNSLQFNAVMLNSDGTAGADVTSTATWNSSDPTIATVSATGLVTAVGQGTVTIAASSGSLSSNLATVVVTSSTGPVFPRFEYVPNEFDDTISIFSVDSASGQLRSAGYVAEPTGSAPASASLDPTGKFLFVANSGTSTVAVYAVNQTNGGLTPVAGSPYAVGQYPRSVGVDPTARFVYIVNSGDYPGDVSAFAYDPNAGSLTAVTGSPFQAGYGASSAVVTPNGEYLYVVNGSAGTVSGFSIDPSTGILTQLGCSPFPAGSDPVALAVSPNGGFLLVANQSSGGGGGLVLLRDDAGRRRGDLAHGPSGLDRGQMQSASLEGVWLSNAYVAGNARIEFMSASYTPKLRFAPTFEPRGGYDFLRFSSLRALPQSAGCSSAQPNFGGGISVFTIDPSSGSLTLIAGSPFAGAVPSALAIDPTGKYVYATNLFGLGVSAFALDSSNGTLSKLSGAPFGNIFSASAVAVDPSGQFVYATSSNSGTVEAFGLDPDIGNLVPLASAPTRQGPSAIAISGGTAPIQYTPLYAYIAASGSAASPGNAAGSNNVLGYGIDPVAGVLSVLSGSPFAEGLFPEATAADPLGRFLYVANLCSDAACVATTGSVSGFQIGQGTGALSSIPGYAFAAGTAPLGAVVDPSGRFEYVLNSKDNTIAAYTVDPMSGALSAIPGSPFPVTGATGTSLALTIDPTGQILFVSTGCPDSSCSGNIFSFAISPTTGVLSLVASTPAGTAPSSLVVEPKAQYLYATDSATGSVLAFSLTRSSGFAGTLNPLRVPSVAAGQSPASVAVDPTGSFLYVADSGSDTIFAYTIDPGGSGSLTPITGSPFPAGANPVSLTVDFSGLFVYVVNEGDNTVSAYSINALTGALTPVAGSPFLAGTVPISITTTGKTQ